MGVFSTLSEKPWLTPSPEGGEDRRKRWSVPIEMMGLRFFLLCVGLIFLLLTSVYSMRMNFVDWRPAPEPWLLWVNTGLLILASVAFQYARNAARAGQADAMKLGLQLAGWLTIAFIAGQLWAWDMLRDMGYYAAANPANAFFYLVTGLHGAHIIGGIVAWMRTIGKLRRGYTVEKIRKSVALCTVYWHFLLLVWIVMFLLLLFT